MFFERSFFFFFLWLVPGDSTLLLLSAALVKVARINYEPGLINDKIIDKIGKTLSYCSFEEYVATAAIFRTFGTFKRGGTSP